MGPGRVGRAGGMHDRQRVRVVDRLERGEARMQAEKAVQVDGGIRRIGGFWDRQRGAQSIVGGVAKRDYDVQAVGGAALKNGDQNLLVQRRGGVGESAASQP